MNQKKPVVFLTRRLPESTETRMRELFDARLREEDTPLPMQSWAQQRKRRMFWSRL